MFVAALVVEIRPSARPVKVVVGAAGVETTLNANDTQTGQRPLKGWRPIVLSNTVGKLAEKIVVDKLQTLTEGFHPLQYGSQKGRSAIDVMMLTISKAERGIKQRHQVTLLGEDVTSAFNNLRSEGKTWDRSAISSPFKTSCSSYHGAGQLAH